MEAKLAVELSRLADADRLMFEVSDGDQLAGWARAVVAVAGFFEGRPEDFAVALGADEDTPWLPEWVLNLVLDLGHAGLGREAAAVGDALARVDPAERATYEADVGVALADAGLAQEARQRVAANLDRWPADFWVRMHAGDALVLLDDRDGAELHFHEALDLADEADDFEGRADAVERLAELERSRRRRR